jgi:hypothetical protein
VDEDHRAGCCHSVLVSVSQERKEKGDCGETKTDVVPGRD